MSCSTSVKMFLNGFGSRQMAVGRLQLLLYEHRDHTLSAISHVTILTNQITVTGVIFPCMDSGMKLPTNDMRTEVLD